ncbi:MAG TPA: ChbG/HpnK family deacetylase [Urbifossiella sp.]|nr:ChbG/HpnK family deacetylase [Urbifossiella sp.]
MARLRQLAVVADDFGIGPETDRGILELAKRCRITSTVLLVNSPYAADAVSAWKRAGRPIELGWHPNLTLDRPLLAPDLVPTLVDKNGVFHSLGRFLRNSYFGRISPADAFAELTAQYGLFVKLTGQPPALVNSHQHVALFAPIAAVLHDLLTSFPHRPFVRRVREPRATLRGIPGARIKRWLLDRRGRRQAESLDRDGFPGCDWLAGITDPHCVQDPRFFENWLAAMPGATVELMCHPGHHDRTLIGRDCPSDGIALERRAHELNHLASDAFPEAVRRAGFELMPASRIGRAPVRVAA